ncbi:MAG: CZB domain-containing protein [Desulfuromonadaceae bacterium]|nr:CZB domain-containing protein [Desulfuromonadaceae bacterium]
MNWQNIRLSGKFAIGFGLVLLLLSLIAGWSIFGVGSIVDDAKEVISGNALRAEMIQREVDHLEWANQVNALLTNDQITKLEVETDPRKCGFGKWYYGEGRKQAEALVPELKGVLAQIEEPHRHLHESAVTIGQTFRQADLSLPKFLAEKETDHLAWANAILTVFAANKTSINVQTDSHRCGLGLFLNSDKARLAAASDPELARLFQAIKAPHERLHKSAVAIERNLADRNKAYKIFQSQTLPALAETQTQLQQLKQRAEELVDGMQQASTIYATKTMPALQQVKTLLGNVIKSTADNIMTDEEMLHAASSTRTGNIVLGAVALPLGIFFAWIIARGIIGPLKRSCAMIEEMEKGHLDMRLNLTRQDEIGQMAQSMDRFANSLQNEMVGSLQKLAASDLTFEVVPRDGQDAIRGALNQLGQDLNGLVSELYTSGEQIASGSMQVADGSQSLSQGATESAASVEEITASMTELASQTKQNAENATQANQLVLQAKDAAEKGNHQMQDMVGAMAEINEAGKNISKIIKVIDEIAFQTNLLALNAAVEAARAGQHGKGFAVVAEEVRNLAARSAQAAKETAELIEGSVQKTANGTQIAGQTESALKEIVTAVIKATDLVSEIAAASNEQSQGIGQINQGLNQIDQVTQQNTANAEESAAAAEELSGQAEQLRQMLSRFKLNDQVSLQRSNPVKSADTPAFVASPAQISAATQQPVQPTIALDDSEFGKY